MWCKLGGVPWVAQAGSSTQCDASCVTGTTWDVWWKLHEAPTGGHVPDPNNRTGRPPASTG
eukprot:5944597-Pyramimonas_sp.AAC.1